MAGLSPAFLEQLAQPLVDVYTSLEDELIQNIAKHFNTGKGLATQEWQLKKLAELGALTQDNIKTIAKYVGQIPELTKLALESAAFETLKMLEPQFAEAVKLGYLNPTDTPPMSPSVKQALENYAKQAVDDFNLVKTTMLNSSLDAYKKAIANTVAATNYDAAQKIMNTAAGEVVTGVKSRQKALTDAIKKMADEGITAFYDKAGRKWSPEAYINMDIRTTATNTAHATTFARCDDYGNDLIEISSHAGARPKCASDQGKIFSRSNKGGSTKDGNGRSITFYPWSSSSNGAPDGILGINCGHFASPFFAGLSYKRAEETKDFEQNAKDYAESQQQRQLERDVKNAKREAMAQKAAGNQEGYEEAAAKLKAKQSQYKGFCSDTGRTPRNDRLQVAGYDKKTAQDVKNTNYATAKKQKEKATAAQQQLDTKHAEMYNKSKAKAAVERTSTPSGYKTFAADADIPEWLKEQSKNWTYAEKEALRYYTGSAYADINGALRGKKAPTAKVSKATDNIASGISKSTIDENIVTWRGAHYKNFVESTMLESKSPSEWIGKTITDEAFVSSSLFKDRAFSSKPIFMQILVPQGSTGAYLKELSQFSSEYELLFQKGSTFKILEATQSGNKVFVKVLFKGGKA